ncbi:MAG: hypothetical protein HYW26_00770 [Candidatus Aenigmarchaeota archaeon]|nr:hypothetical protein [Candidatus Aenigmarchaeota archaeon]
MGRFALSNLARTYTNQVPAVVEGMPLDDWAHKNIGNLVFALPYEGHTRINPTGPPGFISGIYFSLVFQLRKWEFFVQKADEWIEVSPVHQQYYQLTVKQKQEVEQQIKAGLASAAQSVADLELLKHDERKYREFLDYFGYEYDESANGFKEKKEKDEHALRSVFIDQVDVHTGEGIAIRTIVSRWPTLIVDFMKLNDSDTDPDKVKEKMDVSKAEAVVLVTKNKLYMEWKKLFGGEIQDRFRRIRELVRSRESSVDQYREWLKPYVARHQILQEGLGIGPGARSTLSSLFAMPAGHATSFNQIELWTWREFGATPPELYKGGTELLGQERAEGAVRPYDSWTKKNLIFHKDHGLVADFPWITDEWVKEQEKFMTTRESQGAGIRPWIDPVKMYYSFFIITLEKLNIRMPTGSEMEDGTFDVNYIYMSENALFAKLLEMKAKQVEMNHYIDNLIGVRDPGCPICTPKGQKPKDERDWLQPAKKFFDYFGFEFMFAKKGPYEHDFFERISKGHVRSAAYARYATITNFIKQKSGYGQ